MNTEIIKGQAQQILELVDTIENMRRDSENVMSWLDEKDKQILKLESTVSAQSASLKEAENKRSALEVENYRLKKKTEELETVAGKSKKEEMFMIQKNIEFLREMDRLKGLLARNGIKYKRKKDNA